MKATPQDPDLTAYVLDELSELESAAFQKQLSTSPELGREVAEVSAMANMLRATLGANLPEESDLSLGDERRSEIFRSGYRPDAEDLILKHRRRSRRQSTLAVTGVAAAVVLGFVGLSKLQVGRTPEANTVGTSSNPSANDTVEAAGNGAPGTGPGENHLLIQPQGVSGPELAREMYLPLSEPPIDFGKIESVLMNDGKIPAPEMFSIDAWSNLSKPSGPGEYRLGSVSLRSEVGPCSWDENLSLLVISLSPLEELKPEVLAKVSFLPDRVKSARYLGDLRNEGNSSIEPGESKTPAWTALSGPRTLIFEMELDSDHEAPGEIDLRVIPEGGEGFLTDVVLLDEPLAEGETVSLDFRLAATFAGFGEWGAGEGRDRKVLKTLADEARLLLKQTTIQEVRYGLDLILLTEEVMEDK